MYIVFMALPIVSKISLFSRGDLLAHYEHVSLGGLFIDTSIKNIVKFHVVIKLLVEAITIGIQ